MLGFSLGWIGRGHTVARVQNQPVKPAVSALESRSPVAKSADAPGIYEVALTDENGNIIATQKFNRVEDARQFASDWGQMQARQKQVQQGRPMLVSDQF
jgi:hypothetical protein